MSLEGCGPLVLNPGQTGYYRSAYPPNNYKALVAGVETDLTPSERIALTGDEWAQVRANKATIGAYLDLVGALKADSSAEVIGNSLGGVNTAYERIADTPEEKAALSAWIRNTFAPPFAKLGPPSPDDSPNTRELRAQLFGVLGYYAKDPAVLAMARQIVDKYLADRTSFDPTLGQTALYIAARNGDAALFDKLQNVYETSTNPEFQVTALHLLAQFEDPALVKRSLDYTVSGKVRNQDAAIQLTTALQIDATRDLAWQYMKTNWDKVQAQFTTAMGGYVVGSTGSFCTAEARDDVTSFFSTHKVAASDKALKHAVEHIDGCIELRKLQEPNLKQWLAAQPGL